MARRREKRASLALPVKVYGLDASGNSFVQTACTLQLGRYGARVCGMNRLQKPGAILTLEYKNHKNAFRVVWAGSPGTPWEGQLGLENLQPDRAPLGVDLPPPKADDYDAPEPAQAPLKPVVTLSAGKERRRGERRRHPRYRCLGEVDLANTATGVVGRATLSDISGGGCYVETQSPFPQGTGVEMTLHINQTSIRGNALVKASHPGQGMCLAFNEIKPEDSPLLRHLLEALSEAQLTKSAGLCAPDLASPPEAAGAALVESIVQWFAANESLSRAQFRELLWPELKEKHPGDRAVSAVGEKELATQRG